MGALIQKSWHSHHKLSLGFALAFLLILMTGGNASAQFSDDIASPPEVEFISPYGEYVEGQVFEYKIIVKPPLGLHVYRDKLDVKLDSFDGILLDRIDLPEGERRLAFAGHSLRAGLATGADVEEALVQRQLGHASAETTRSYKRRRERFKVNLTRASGL